METGGKQVAQGVRYLLFWLFLGTVAAVHFSTFHLEKQMLYEQLLFPYLTKKYPNPEDAHHVVLELLEMVSGSRLLCGLLKRTFAVEDYRHRVRLAGISFPNRVGLAAGYAKGPIGLNALAALGFGFLEIGTITPELQKGNDQPRIFRLEKDGALINRMGFPNGGAIPAASRLSQIGKLPVPIGVNIGKGRDTPLEDAAKDYVYCYTALAPFADYVVVNVSSPNTPGLRTLQGKRQLGEILRALSKTAELQDGDPLDNHGKVQVPIFIKVDPDGDDAQLADICEVASGFRIVSGIVATNTTRARESLHSDDQLVNEQGGLSGRPLHYRSCDVVSFIRKRCPNFVIIGVGGINSPDDAKRMRDAGADLIQVYTAMVYKGPMLPGQLVRALSV